MLFTMETYDSFNDIFIPGQDRRETTREKQS